MSKRKETEPDPEEEEEEEEGDHDSHRRGHNTKSQPQKVYDFHKKTVEVYPARLLELNRQFAASITSQIANEPYSVLVGNCLDYVRQYFLYEDDLLKHSPWLAVRLKQCHTGVIRCLQETIDMYDELARDNFDRLFDQNCSIDTIEPTPRPSSELLSVSTSKTDTPTQSISSFGQFPPSTITASSPTPPPSFSFTKASTANTEVSPSMSTFNFKMPTTMTTTSTSISSSPAKTTLASPFAFTLSSTGFGTNTFNSSNFGTTTTTTTTPKSTILPFDAEKQSSGSTSSTINSSFLDFKAATSKFSFTPIVTSSGDSQPPTTEENDEESSEPPQPEKVDHEADAKLTYRCRMGVNKSGKLIKRGPVQVILKETDGKHQLIVRSDDALGRLFLNIIWSKLIEIKKHSTKDLTFVCKLNPGMPEVAQGEIVMILFRFDSETDRNEAYDKLGAERS